MYIDVIEKRRSIYALNKKLPIPEEDLIALVERVVVASPTAYNMQSAKMVILLKEEHQNFWEVVEETLRKVVPTDKFKPTQEKMEGFKRAYGTILFLEDEELVEEKKKENPRYKDAFDMFAAHGMGILQGNIWNALIEQGIGANLQHYNPLIDEEVKRRWKIDDSLTLVAQMVFGGIEEYPKPIEKMDASKRIKVAGAKDHPQNKEHKKREKNMKQQKEIMNQVKETATEMMSKGEEMLKDAKTTSKHILSEIKDRGSDLIESVNEKSEDVIDTIKEKLEKK